MSMTIGAAIATMSISKSVAAYYGLIDDPLSEVKAVIQQSIHQPFKSAILNLELAKTSSVKSQSEEYLKEARNKFIEAITVEQDESLVSALVGLAMCQYLLGDHGNASLTISKISDVHYSRFSEDKLGKRKKIEGAGFLGSILNSINENMDKIEQNALQRFENFKLKAISEMKYLN